MAISDLTSGILGGNLAITDTVPKFAPGTVLQGSYAGEFVYSRAAAAIAAGDFVVLSKDYVASLLTTSNSPLGAKVGVARSAIAANDFGWVQIGGQAPGRTAGAITVNARINTTATGGAVDDDGTAGAKVISGINIPVAAGGATTNTEFSLTHPVVGATL